MVVEPYLRMQTASNNLRQLIDFGKIFRDATVQFVIDDRVDIFNWILSLLIFIQLEKAIVFYSIKKYSNLPLPFSDKPWCETAENLTWK